MVFCTRAFFAFRRHVAHRVATVACLLLVTTVLWSMVVFAASPAGFQIETFGACTARVAVLAACLALVVLPRTPFLGVVLGFASRARIGGRGLSG